MDSDEYKLMEPVSADEKTLDAGRQIIRHRGCTLGILVAAIVLA